VVQKETCLGTDYFDRMTDKHNCLHTKKRPKKNPNRLPLLILLTGKVYDCEGENILIIIDLPELLNSVNSTI